MNKYPVEIVEYIREIANGRDSDQIWHMVNDKFNLDLKKLVVVNLMKRNHIHNNMRGKAEGSKKTQIKKGQRLSPETEFGGIRETKHKVKGIAYDDGTITILNRKVKTYRYKDAKIKIAGKWMNLKKYLWEQAGRTIPENCILVWKDGNPSNQSIENIACITKSEFKQMLWFGYGVNNRTGDDFDLCLMRSKLKLAISRRENNK